MGKNHGEKAEIRYDLLYGFFIEEGICIKPKKTVSSYLSGIYDKCLCDSVNVENLCSPRAKEIFEEIKDINDVFLFYGPKGIGKKECFKLLCEYKGFTPVIIDDREKAERELFFAAVENMAVAVCSEEIIDVANNYLPYLTFCTWIFENPPISIKACRIFFSPLDMEERYDIWHKTAEKYDFEKDINFRVLANQYILSPEEIKESFYNAKQISHVKGERNISKETLYESVHNVLSHHFESRAKRVQCQYSWDDLILPDIQKGKLMEYCHQVEFRHVVMEKWGLAKINNYDGITVLFYGSPGTGKTMAAQVIASYLGMELYKAELSSVVSKYIGETEKNLKKIFEDASKSQAILFFDEADALFGKRTEVKDSHDKYSNMEASFLLQEMEQYKGVVILATNFVENIDEAFKRRMKFIIEFPFPSANERHEIWKRAVPEKMPLDKDVDFEFLAERFEMTGSSIKNAVYSAAFLAAANDKQIGMEELILAVKSEYEKTGKIFSYGDAGIYSSYIKQKG